VSSNNLDDLTVVIPVLNEAKAIGRVIDEVLDAGVPRDNIIVVDGGSTDGTVELVKSKNIKIIRQEGSGKALAIKTGLKYVRTPYVLVMDGDYTYPARHIPELYNKITGGDLDLVIGSRKFCEKNQGVIYRLGNWFLTKLFNLLFGTKLSDVLSGMYIARTDRFREIMFEMPGFSVESELVAHIATTTGKIGETPIGYRKRIGDKKLKPFHGITIARDIIRLTWRYHPAFFIFILGSLMLIPGLVIGAWVAYHYFFTGIKYYVKGIIAVILAIGGIASLFHATMAIYVKRIELRMRQKIESLEKRIEELLGGKQINEKP